MAVLCDAATVREGLLSVLGAGISKVAPARLPTGVPVAIAIMLEYDRNGLQVGEQHSVGVRVVGPDDQLVLEESSIWALQEPSPIADLPLLVPFAASLAGAQIQVGGLHFVCLDLDGEEAARLPLLVVAEDGTVDTVS